MDSGTAGFGPKGLGKCAQALAAEGAEEIVT